MLKIQIIAASANEPDELTINFGRDGHGDQFPDELNAALRDLPKGRRVILRPKLHLLRAPWDWIWTVNRSGDSISTRFVSDRLTRPTPGNPVWANLKQVEVEVSEGFFSCFSFEQATEPHDAFRTC